MWTPLISDLEQKEIPPTHPFLDLDLPNNFRDLGDGFSHAAAGTHLCERSKKAKPRVLRLEAAALILLPRLGWSSATDNQHSGCWLAFGESDVADPFDQAFALSHAAAGTHLSERSKKAK